MHNDGEFIIEPLSTKHHKKDFVCGEPSLDRYIKEQSSQDLKRNLSVTYALVDKNNHIVAGYYTLSSMSVLLENLPENLQKKFPKYPMIPVTLLGRLAIDQNYQRKMLGEYLLVDALRRSFQANQQIASWAVVVDAINDKAVSFYKHFGFTAFVNDSMRLFLPMNVIETLGL